MSPEEFAAKWGYPILDQNARDAERAAEEERRRAVVRANLARFEAESRERWRREQARQARQARIQGCQTGPVAGLANLCAAIGALALGLPTFLWCLLGGPLFWLLGFILVPIAAAIGAAAGVVVVPLLVAMALLSLLPHP
jgi:hypothetical protein